MVLELAMAEAHELGHSYIGTEHLLLGLVREQRGIAAQVLIELGLQLEPARAETLRLLDMTAPGRRDRAAEGDANATRRPIVIRVHIDYEGGTWSLDSFDQVEEAIEFLWELRG